jgi:hypothetical protein
MSRIAVIALGIAVASASLAGCQTPAVAAEQQKPVSGFVTDMAAFESFIATHPTATQFKTAYPDVLLVTPGMITTREMRSNNSRYYGKFDKDGRIVGGNFM